MPNPPVVDWTSDSTTLTWYQPQTRTWSGTSCRRGAPIATPSVTAAGGSSQRCRLASGATGAHVKAGLAGYQAPKRVLMTDIIGRAPNGEVDDTRLKQYAAELA